MTTYRCKLIRKIADHSNITIELDLAHSFVITDIALFFFLIRTIIGDLYTVSLRYIYTVGYIVCTTFYIFDENYLHTSHRRSHLLCINSEFIYLTIRGNGDSSFRLRLIQNSTNINSTCAVGRMRGIPGVLHMS